MANTILTPTAVTREVLRVAHEKLSFIGTVQRQYDDSYAKSGAKIGDTLKIRLPNQYTVRTGKTLNVQDTSETSVSLTVATQKGVDMNFSSAELTMDLDDFSTRIIEPAVSVLISTIESDMLAAVTPDVYNAVGTPGTAPTFLQVMQGKAKLNQNLAPKSRNERCAQVDSVDMVALVNELKTLQNDPNQVSKQYREGLVAMAGGLNFYENERIHRHTTGGDMAGTVNDTPEEGDSTLTVASADFTAGDVFTFAGVKAVHPETKIAMSHDQQFVATADGTTSLSFSPSLQASGANQNIDHLPSNSDAITFIGTASTAYSQQLIYHKEAFAFASADLELPSGVHFAGREQMDGLSVRLVRQYDINNDNLPCRLDILHGYKTLRAGWACRAYGT